MTTTSVLNGELEAFASAVASDITAIEKKVDSANTAVAGLASAVNTTLANAATNAAKAQGDFEQVVLNNIAAVEKKVGDVSTAVLAGSTQSLPDDQKAQARQNIGAVSMGDLQTIVDAAVKAALDASGEDFAAKYAALRSGKA